MHRRRLNAVLAKWLPLPGLVLEIGNGRVRRGVATGATWTLDLASWRRPTIQGDGRWLPFKDHCVDGIVCCETLQYVPACDVLLHECKRILKRGGRLVLSLPAGLPPQADEFKVDKWFYRAPRWTRDAAVFTLELAGFTVQKMTPLWPPFAWRTSGWVIEARAITSSPIQSAFASSRRRPLDSPCRAS